MFLSQGSGRWTPKDLQINNDSFFVFRQKCSIEAPGDKSKRGLYFLRTSSLVLIFIYLFDCAKSWLWHPVSLAVPLELLVVPCGIQLPDQGSNLDSQHWEFILSHWTAT